MNKTLRIAIQTKGRLNEESLLLLDESGIKLIEGKRRLISSAKNFPLEVLYLRDDDIPQCVADGVADVGIVGKNEMDEQKKLVEVIKYLGFSKCRLSLAIPKDVEYLELGWFEGKKIATSYPAILKDFLETNNIHADIHFIAGSVEISVEPNTLLTGASPRAAPPAAAILIKSLRLFLLLLFVILL